MHCLRRGLCSNPSPRGLAGIVRQRRTDRSTRTQLDKEEMGDHSLITVRESGPPQEAMGIGG